MATVLSPLSADTQVALLLTAPLGKRSNGSAKPLSPAEYAEITRGLHAEARRPAELLSLDVATILPIVLEHVSPRRRDELSASRILALLERGGSLALSLSRWMAIGIWVASRVDDSYPSRYKRLPRNAAPPVVYGVGPATLVEKGGVAVVGSREPDELSIEHAESVGSWGARTGIQIVSGAARGVDELSMHGSLRASGTALGVVAESLIRVASRRGFREAIIDERLTLLSAIDPEAGFSVPAAMARNRLIYSLADRALIVACSEGRGGTWAGAVAALKTDIPVFAMTGNPARPGNEALIRLGAIPASANFDALLHDRPRPPISTTKEPSLALPLEKPRILSSDDRGRDGEITQPDQAHDIDTFSIVAPHLVQLLHRPMTAKQFADAACLAPKQGMIWLARLVSEGRVVKEKRAFRSIEPQRGQPSLFTTSEAMTRERTPAALSPRN